MCIESRGVAVAGKQVSLHLVDKFNGLLLIQSLRVISRKATSFQRSQDSRGQGNNLGIEVQYIAFSLSTG